MSGIYLRSMNVAHAGLANLYIHLQVWRSRTEARSTGSNPGLVDKNKRSRNEVRSPPYFERFKHQRWRPEVPVHLEYYDWVKVNPWGGLWDMFFLMKDSSEFLARQHVQNETIRVLIKSPKSRTYWGASIPSIANACESAINSLNYWGNSTRSKSGLPNKDKSLRHELRVAYFDKHQWCIADGLQNETIRALINKEGLYIHYSTTNQMHVSCTSYLSALSFNQSQIWA